MRRGDASVQYRDLNREKVVAHIAEVACPVFCALGAESQFNTDLKILVDENLLRANLIDVFGLSVYEEREHRGAVNGDKGNRDTRGDQRLAERLK